MDVSGTQAFIGVWHMDYSRLFEPSQIICSALRCVTIGLLRFGDRWKSIFVAFERCLNRCTGHLRFHECLVQMALDRSSNVQDCYKLFLFGFEKRSRQVLSLREF